MNRENKRKTFGQGYYKTHACYESSPQGLRPAGNAGKCRQRPPQPRPNCLTSLHVDIEPGDRASDCGGHMEPVAVWVRRGGEWAIIHRLQAVRGFQLQPRGSRRQPPEADEHCYAAAVRAAVPIGIPGGDDRPDGRRGEPVARDRGALCFPL